MKNNLITFLSVLFSINLYSVDCDNLKSTVGSYSETVNLTTALQGEYGSNYVVADWNDIAAITDLNAWIACMGLVEDQTFMVTYNGDFMYNGGNRQYYVQYSSDGVPYPSFAVHAQLSPGLYLGSWYGLNMSVLGFKGCSGITECNNLKPTCSSYSETVNLTTALQGEYGSNYVVADWNDIAAITDLNAWIACMGLVEDQTFMVTYNGDFMYNGGNRQYYVQYSSDGVPYPGFAVHAQLSPGLYLGSWYGLNMSVLCKNEIISSITSSAINAGISIYPNPTQGMINIDFGGLKNVTISIYSLNGQLIYRQENINNEKYQFELNVAKGVYVIELISNGEIHTYKLIKK